MTNVCPECEAFLYPRAPVEVSHERFTRDRYLHYEFQATSEYASTTQSIFDTSFISIGLPLGWSTKTIQMFYKNLLIKAFKQLLMNNKIKQQQQQKNNNTALLPLNIKSGKSIQVSVFHHINNVKLITVSLNKRKQENKNQMYKFIANLIDNFFHLQTDKASIEFLEKGRSFVIQVHSCPYCELFDLTKKLSWDTRTLKDNQIHYRSLEALCRLLHYELPSYSMRKTDMAKVLMRTESGISNFTDDRS